MLPQFTRESPDEGGQNGPVRPGQAWPAYLAAQHGDLVAQHQQLGDYRGLAACHVRQQAEHPNCGQVQQPNNHARHPDRPPQRTSSRPV